uniref:Uncharacterized protein n=1 Tax=Anguilla anguilla TaxID=7936 RepID=A0A0E9WVQ3_ANGAN
MAATVKSYTIFTFVRSGTCNEAPYREKTYKHTVATNKQVNKKTHPLKKSNSLPRNDGSVALRPSQ